MRPIYYKKPIIFVLLFYFLTSCDETVSFEFPFSEPVFKDTLEVPAIPLNDTFHTSFVEDIALYNNYLIVKGRTKENYLLTIFDRNNGKRIKSFASIGRGPGEVLTLSKITIDPLTGILYTKDLLKNEVYGFKIDSVISNATDYYSYRSLPDHMKTLNYVFPLPEGFLLVSEKSELCRLPYLCLVDREGQVEDRYDNYPSVKGGELDTVLPFYLQLEPRIAGSLHGDKLVDITSLGGIFRIFDLKSGIRLTYLRGFCEPDYDLEWLNKKYLVLKKNDRSRKVVEDVYATDRYIYIQYTGIKGRISHKDIAVFTWQGEAVRLYKTDLNIGRFCVDAQDKRLYFSDYDEHLAYFDL